MPVALGASYRLACHPLHMSRSGEGARYNSLKRLHAFFVCMHHARRVVAEHASMGGGVYTPGGPDTDACFGLRRVSSVSLLVFVPA